MMDAKNIGAESPTARREEATFPGVGPLMCVCDAWKHRPLSRAGSPKNKKKPAALTAFPSIAHPKPYIFT